VSQESAQSSRPGVECQLEAFPANTPTGAPSREEPWAWYLRRRWQGLLLRLGRELGRLRRPPPAPPPRLQVSFPAADVREGDLVRVRSVEEIVSTLDATGYLHGCGFGLGQYQFCGRQFRVARRVEHFFDEARARMLRGRNLVLLEGVHCDGSSVRWTAGCQRMCFYFWRTEWLEKVGEP
jgi:hypothetical protein